MTDSVSNNTARSYRYWAFISYSSKDRDWARWLHRGIETYGIPAQFVSHVTPTGEPAPKRFFPLFHDRSEMSAASDLGREIEAALADSRYLIVVCSPHAAQSRWVNTEIETFTRLHGPRRVIALIVGGEPGSGGPLECFPPSLRANEPLAADARPTGDGKINAKLKLLSGMLGVQFDALKQRDTQRRLFRLKMALAAVGSLVIAFATLAFYANRQRLLARDNERRIVEALANSDLREGSRRVRDHETTSEGIALLARAARAGNDAAQKRLWTLLQQRRFWVDVPVSDPSVPALPPSESADPAGPFARVEYDGRLVVPSWFSRSADGKVCVTLFNDGFGLDAHHFRIWRADGKPMTPWHTVKDGDADVRELESAHLTGDGRLVAVVATVWRAPQIVQVWDTMTDTVVGDTVPADGRLPTYQHASFSTIRFLPPAAGEPVGQYRLLTGCSRGGATVQAMRPPYRDIHVLGRNDHAAEVQAVSVDARGEWLISASTDGQVLVLDLRNGAPLGNVIALPTGVQALSRVGDDRIRLVRTGPLVSEYRLMPKTTVPLPKEFVFSETMLDDALSDGNVPLSTHPLAPLDVGATVETPDGATSVVLVDPRTIAVSRAGHPAWRHAWESSVLHLNVDPKSRWLTVQTSSFTTEVVALESGERVGAIIDERRVFELDIRPSQSLMSGVNPDSGLVLTRSFWWNPPNEAHYWFTVWDLNTGLPITDTDHFSADDVMSAWCTSSGQLLYCGALKDRTVIPARCIESFPPPDLLPHLPAAAEALGGLRVEDDGSFTGVSGRLATINAFHSLSRRQ